MEKGEIRRGGMGGFENELISRKPFIKQYSTARCSDYYCHELKSVRFFSEMCGESEKNNDLKNQFSLFLCICVLY